MYNRGLGLFQFEILMGAEWKKICRGVQRLYIGRFALKHLLRKSNPFWTCKVSKGTQTQVLWNIILLTLQFSCLTQVEPEKILWIFQYFAFFRSSILPKNYKTIWKWCFHFQFDVDMERKLMSWETCHLSWRVVLQQTLTEERWGPLTCSDIDIQWSINLHIPHILFMHCNGCHHIPPWAWSSIPLKPRPRRREWLHLCYQSMSKHSRRLPNKPWINIQWFIVLVVSPHDGIRLYINGIYMAGFPYFEKNSFLTDIRRSWQSELKSNFQMVFYPRKPDMACRSTWF